jgi:hypothetical protein
MESCERVGKRSSRVSGRAVSSALRAAGAAEKPRRISRSAAEAGSKTRRKKPRDGGTFLLAGTG